VQQGSRAAGQQGSRAAGQQGSRAAGQQGSRAKGARKDATTIDFRHGVAIPAYPGCVVPR